MNKYEEALDLLFDLLCEREHTNSEHNFWLKLYQEVRETCKKAEAFDIIISHLDHDIVTIKGDDYVMFSEGPLCHCGDEYASFIVDQKEKEILKEVFKNDKI